MVPVAPIVLASLVDEINAEGLLYHCKIEIVDSVRFDSFCLEGILVFHIRVLPNVAVQHHVLQLIR